MRLKARHKAVYYLVFLVLLLYMDSFFAKIMGATQRVRLPRFAGTWYPAQSNELDKTLSDYLEEAKTNSGKNKQKTAIVNGRDNPHENVIAIIVPHAGYIFSGKTAAFAYKTLKANKYKRIFLLGPSHHIAFRGVVFPSEEVFETPLGEIQIDKSTVQKLLRLPYFNEVDSIFDGEHSLEMQLPWIRKTLGKIKLIPMAVGVVGPEEVKSIANAIKNELTDGDLLIVSSDFTHYGPRFDYQPFDHALSHEKLEAKIKELDLEAFSCLKTLDSQILLDFYARTGDTICGVYPAAVLLSILPVRTSVKLASYSTSQDSGRDPEGNSVSYMSVIFSEADNQGWRATDQTSQMTAIRPLSESEGKTLLKLARLSLQDYLKGQKKDPIEYASIMESGKNVRFIEKHGLFVTLYTKPDHNLIKVDKHGTHKELRGCIGYIYPNKPLLEGVCENVINAASNDPRFKPVTLDELDNLIIEINVLTAPQHVAEWKDINLGRDGIVLHKDNHQSVFLPKVASEFGWDLPQTLSQLSIKAGLSFYDWQKDTQFEVFQSQSFSE